MHQILRNAGSRPPERQVARLSPLGRGLRLVARARPAGPGAAPVVGALGGPGESRASAATRAKRPAGVVVDVGREAQLAAGPAGCGRRRRACRRRGSGACAGAASARDRGRAGRRRSSDAAARRGRSAVASPSQRRMFDRPSRCDRRQELRHAVDEGLAADEARLRPGARLGGEMLAAAEADLEDDRRPVGERSPNSVAGSTGPASGRRSRGRSVARRSCWPLRSGLPLRRPKKAPCGAFPPCGGRPKLRERRPLTRSALPSRPPRHGERRYASADFSCGTRSVRSQEKPPSFCGARPKWP